MQPVDRGGEARRVGDVAGASSAPQLASRGARLGSRTSARTSRPCARSSWTIALPDEPRRAGDEDLHSPSRAKFFQ